MRTIWCEHALLPDGMADGAVLSFSDGVITSIGRATAAPPGADVRRGVTLPGFANAHSHAFHRALRGRTHGGTGDFWTWRDQMYGVAERLDPDSMLAIARAAFAEMVLAGFTVVGEFHYVHHGPDGAPYDDPNAMGHTIVQAATEAGIGLTLLDACYLMAGPGRPAEGVQQRFSDGSAIAWVDRVTALGRGGDGWRTGAAVHSVRAVDPARIPVVAEAALSQGWPLHAHVSEQPAENEACLAAYRRTPIGVFAGAGALSPAFTAVHATHLDEADIDLLGATGCTACFCPTTERDLADGVGPSAALQAAGVALAIGTDQHAVIDPFEELRAIELDERLTTGRRGTHRPIDLLHAGSGAGYASLGWDGGRLSPGGPADLVTVSLESVRLAGADPQDLAAALVFAAAAPDVTHVVVGGRDVVVDGRHVTLDVANELRTAVASLHR